MKRFLYLSLLTLLLVSACSTLLPAPTVTPIPTNTLEPTFTPLPSETPTPLPTSTPDKTATAALKATESASSVRSELDNLLGESDIAYENGQLVWQQTRPMEVKLTGPAWDYVMPDKDMQADNFILKSDVTWEATGIIICGTFLRSEPDLEKGKQYQLIYLRFSGMPAWAIELHEFEYFKNSPTKVQYSNEINQDNGGTNQIVLVAQDDQFTVFINGANQGQYVDSGKQRMEGMIAFHAAQDSGKGTCTFENSWIWKLE